MWVCWHVRKKMIDYFEGALSVASEESVRRHLDACVSCRTVFSQSGSVLRLAASKISARPDEAFWKDFDASLSRKLDALARQRQAHAPRLLFRHHLRPALIMAPLAVVVVALGIRVLPMTPFAQRPVDVSDLVDEVLLLEELSPNGENKDLSLDDMLENIAYVDALNASGV